MALLGALVLAGGGAAAPPPPPPAPPPLAAALYACPACCDHGFELEATPAFTNGSAAGSDLRWARDGDYGLTVSGSAATFVAGGCETLFTAQLCATRPGSCAWDKRGGECSPKPLPGLRYGNASEQVSIHDGAQRLCFAAATPLGFGATVQAEPCVSGSDAQRWAFETHPPMAHLAGRREDSGAMLRSHAAGLCLRPAPYGAADPRYSKTPRVVAVFPCLDADPALQLIVGEHSQAGNLEVQIAWAWDSSHCLEAAANSQVLLLPCNATEQAQRWAVPAAAGQITAHDGRCLVGGATAGAAVTLQKECASGAAWRRSESGGLVSTHTSLCLGHGAGTWMRGATVTGQTPALVHSVTSGYFMFPQTLELFKDTDVPLLHVQASSDDLHDDGWAGRHFASFTRGKTWAEVPNKYPNPGQHIRACLPTKSSGLESGAKELLCLPYPTRCRPQPGPGSCPARPSNTTWQNGTVYRLAPDGSQVTITEQRSIRYNWDAPMIPSGGAGSCVDPKNCVARHSFNADVDGRVKPLRTGGWLQLMEMRAMFSNDGLVWRVRSPLPLCEGRFPIGENDW